MQAHPDAVHVSSAEATGSSQICFSGFRGGVTAGGLGKPLGLRHCLPFGLDRSGQGSGLIQIQLAGHLFCGRSSFLCSVHLEAAGGIPSGLHCLLVPSQSRLVREEAGAGDNKPASFSHNSSQVPSELWALAVNPHSV